MISVVNKKTYKGPGVYIGRPSVLGNPVSMGSECDREWAITEYKSWFKEQYAVNEGFRNYVNALAAQAKKGDLVLICWCVPKACHGDVVKDFILYLNGEPSNW